jgi:mannose/fructose/N-acetylgalactosamine-specific phosphotransferase system component IID
MGSDDNRPSRLTFKTFLQLYIRSFFIQGSFSVKYRQNLGFAFCMEPVGKILFEDPEQYKTFLIRHLDYYNGNPFMVTLVLGAVAKMEEMLCCNEGVTGNDIYRFKKAVSPATGSVGDRFFWSTLRPFGIILVLFAAVFWGFWCVLILLAAFTLPTFVLRWYWLKTGYMLGTGVISEIKNRKLESVAHFMEILNAVLIAFLTATKVALPDSSISWFSLTAAVLFVMSFFLLKRAVSKTLVLLFSLGIVIISGIVLSFVVY